MLKKAILGISSFVLTTEEISLFREYKPYGIILFKRNCDTEQQLKELIHSIKQLSPESKILIDQEGGRVARLKKPNFIEFPAANTLNTQEKSYDNYFIMGGYLKSLGIDMNCAPVADLYYPYADNIIGDRSFGEDALTVAKLALSAAEGLNDSGILPVIKHIPGHGRALVDSHLDLPVIDTDLATLEETDFAVFKQLNHLPIAMTAHIIYKALDPELPITLSKTAIKYIRDKIGFKGLLITDDLNMKALKGNLVDLAKQSINAGCDFVCHCNGNINEMRALLSVL